MRLTKDGILRINFRGYNDNTRRLRCNFRCSYCIQMGQKVSEYPFTSEHFQQTKFIWDALSGVEDQIMVRLNFNGETFIDEWAMRCALYVNKVANVKVCEFITNNSVPPRTYLSGLDVTKTTFNCSFHPEFMSIEGFIENVLVLKNAGCDVFVNVCALPQLIDKIPEMRDTCNKHGITLKLQGFLTLGNYYNGRQYPRGYTFWQRRKLRKLFYTEDEYRYFVDYKRTRGKDCYAGVDMVNIFLDGSVKRCFTGDVGNVHDLVSGKVRLKDSPYPCHENFCPCNAHFIGLKEHREKYLLSERFVDNYDIRKI